MTVLKAGRALRLSRKGDALELVRLYLPLSNEVLGRGAAQGLTVLCWLTSRPHLGRQKGEVWACDGGQGASGLP